MPDRDVLDVLTTPGYVSIITGEPGAGKTTLALMACARQGRCTYVSYADPPQALESKLRAVSPGFKGSFKVINALSGSPEDVFSRIAEASGRGELVIVDTADAMLYEVERGLRALLQLVYGSVKVKQGSLVLISEGDSRVFSQLKYVADAVIRIDLEDIMGQRARAVRLLKDRDRRIERPLQYMTLSNMKVAEPLHILERPKLGRLSSVKLPQYLQVKSQLETGPNMLVELDLSISDIRARLVQEFFAAHYLVSGYAVKYLVGPNEPEDLVREDIESLAGESARNLRIIKADARSIGFSAKAYFQQLLESYEASSISIINLLADEGFAVNAPLEYENFVEMVTRYNVEGKRLTVLYGHSNLKAMEIQRKYANALRRFTVTDGYLFWRSMRPLGPLYYVDMRPERGSIEFVEMV